MSNTTGFSKFLTAVGIDEAAQEKLQKNTDEAGKIIGSVGDNILGTMADYIEISKPLAKKAYQKAEEGLEMAGEQLEKGFDKASDAVQDIMGDVSDAVDSTEEVKSSEAEVENNIRTPEQMKVIQDITAGLNYLDSTVDSCTIDYSTCSQISMIISLVRHVLNNSNGPFDELMEKGLDALNTLEQKIYYMNKNSLSYDGLSHIQDIHNSIIHLTNIVKATLDSTKEEKVDSEKADSDPVVQEFDELFGGLFQVMEGVAEAMNEAMEPQSKSKDAEKSETVSEETTDSEETETASEGTTDSDPEIPGKSLDEEVEEIIAGLTNWFEKDILPEMENTSKEITGKIGNLLKKIGKDIQNMADDKEDKTKNTKEHF